MKQASYSVFSCWSCAAGWALRTGRHNYWVFWWMGLILGLQCECVPDAEQIYIETSSEPYENKHTLSRTRR